ncbi:VOC family protein [Frigoribacterium faeni]|uniref:VOC family protein n=1 Tax=Frigoribacterium faeni TaxID=145483 RepID=UPI00141BBD1D|nr:putative enzyme related to lactoylglutathione lyase [Frigoribacterium faeni]
MALVWEQVVVDAVDPEALAAWWREALDWVTVSEPGDEPELRPAADSLPGLLFVRVPEPKSVKDRLHLDFRPDDQAAEVARLEALGATRVDVGQVDPSWVVLADPEGNEFCVLGSRHDG